LLNEGKIKSDSDIKKEGLPQAPALSREKDESK
jgi:hypothetical protein